MINQNEHVALVKKFFPRLNQLRVVGNEYDNTTFIICDETMESDIHIWYRLFMVSRPALVIQYITSCKDTDLAEADFIQLRAYWMRHQNMMVTRHIGSNMNQSWFQKVKQAILGSAED